MMANHSTLVGQDTYYPLRALAAYSGLSVRTLRSYLTSRVRPLPHYRIGGKIVVRRSEFDTWVAQFRVATATATVDVVVDDIMSTLQ